MVRLWSNRNSHSLVVEMQDGTSTLENSLAVSYKTKYTLKPYHPESVLFSIYSKEFKLKSIQKPVLGCSKDIKLIVIPD